LRYGAKY